MRLALSAVCALLIAGCAGDAEPDAEAAAESAAIGPSPSPSAATAPSMTVQQLASAVGCTAEIQSKAADYRQATCKNEQADYVLVDFDTVEGQRAWLDYAEMYGGIYLVGDRWALSAKSKEYMESLRAKLGGTVEERGAFSSSPSPTSAQAETAAP
ncbi:hypothetical protein [Streptomyces virginiae]|uniref:hypothetical protein n=1 Tax=Streptomyces virginiae TaxID=1961 RepID=UPI00224E727B|nr:hypothetical protein [Streptomyces virginiae]MCX5270082.1 hypothetical protein [Streptomyces virginiae]